MTVYGKYVVSHTLPEETDPTTVVGENFTLTGMISGGTASVSDAVYYPADNRVELIIESTTGRYSENYSITGKLLDWDGNRLDVIAENCGIVTEKTPENDTVSITKILYEKDGIPLYNLEDKNDVTAVVKVVNSTGQDVYNLRVEANCGSGEKVFYSEMFDMEAESCKLVTVDVTDYSIRDNRDIRISLEHEGE